MLELKPTSDQSLRSRTGQMSVEATSPQLWEDSYSQRHSDANDLRGLLCLALRGQDLSGRKSVLPFSCPDDMPS